MAAAIKLVVVGSTGSGKSCLIHKFDKNEYLPQMSSTVGQLYVKHEYTSPRHGSVRVDIWDTAGQERQRVNVPQFYFRNTDGVILCVQQANSASLESVEQFWLPCVDHQAQLAPQFKIVCITQVDMRRRDADVEERLAQLVRDHGVTVFDTSALTGENVVEAFETLIGRILDARCAASAESSKNTSPARGSTGTSKAPRRSILRDPVPIPDDPEPAADTASAGAVEGPIAARGPPSNAGVATGQEVPSNEASSQGQSSCIPVRCIVA